MIPQAPGGAPGRDFLLNGLGRVLLCVRCRLGADAAARDRLASLDPRAFAARLEDCIAQNPREPGELWLWLAEELERLVRTPDAALLLEPLSESARETLTLLQAGPGPLALVDGSESFPRRGESGDEARAKFETALPKLREEYRELILLRDIAGCSWAVVAENLGLPTVQASCMLHSRARIALSTHLR